MTAKIYNFSKNKKPVLLRGTLSEIKMTTESSTPHKEIDKYLRSQNIISNETTTIYARNLYLNLFEKITGNRKWVSHWHRIHYHKLKNADSVCFITFIKEENLIKLFSLNKQEINYLMRNSQIGHRDYYNFMIGEKLF